MTAPSILPPGSKLWVSFMFSIFINGAKADNVQLLDLGVLDIDASYVLSGANVPLHGVKPQQHECRPCLMIAGLLYHPDKGLILLDTGSREDIIQSRDKEFLECAPRIWDKNIHSLPEAIKATGAGEIGDVKAVVMSHLHLDHAGGLEHFFGTGKRSLTNFKGVVTDQIQTLRFGATNPSSKMHSGHPPPVSTPVSSFQTISALIS